MQATWPEASSGSIQAPTTLKTSRLFLRPPAPSDTYWFVNLQRDAAAMQYRPPDGTPASFARARDRYDSVLRHWRRHEFGSFVVEHRTSEERLGVCGLRWMETWELELDCHFSSLEVRDSVAEEAASACIRYAEQRIRIEKLVALAHPQDHAAQSLLRRLDFLRLPERDGVYGGLYQMFFIRRTQR